MSGSLILGIDPGLRRCGWGLVRVSGSRLQHVGHGLVTPDTKASLGARLVQLQQGLDDVLDTHAIAAVAVEQTFQNSNPQASLNLGMARGICLLVAAMRGLPCQDYAPNSVKKAVVGKGHADKEQMIMMVSRLLPGAGTLSSDEADALALAICHAHHWQFASTLAQTGKT